MWDTSPSQIDESSHVGQDKESPYLTLIEIFIYMKILIRLSILCQPFEQN